VKIRAYAIYVVAILIATVLAFVLPHDEGQIAGLMAVTFAIVTVFSLVVGSKRGADFILGKPKWVRPAGVAVLALALIGPFVARLSTSISPNSTVRSDEPYVWAALMIALVGFLLISAPRLARQTQEVRALQAVQALAPTSPPVALGVIGDGVAALARLTKDIRLFLTIAWLWLLLSTGPLVLAGVAWAAGYVEPAIQVAGIGVGWLCFVVGLPTVLVAWHRWLMEGHKPRGLTLPDRRSFSYGWRLWIYLAVASRAANWASEAAGHWALRGGLVQAFVPAALVNALVFALICALFSVQALRLAAVAVGAAEFSLPVALAAARRMRLALPLGVLAALAPFLAFRALAAIGILATGQTLTAVAITFAMEFAVQFFAFAAAAALVSSAYMKVMADLRAPSSSQ
jgi:hypothetical protein